MSSCPGARRLQPGRRLHGAPGSCVARLAGGIRERHDLMSICSPPRHAGPFGRRQKRARGSRLPVIDRHRLSRRRQDHAGAALPRQRRRAAAPRSSSTSSARRHRRRAAARERRRGRRCSATAACAATPAPTCRSRCASSSPTATAAESRISSRVRDRDQRARRSRPDPADLLHRPRARRRVRHRGGAHGGRRGVRAANSTRRPRRASRRSWPTASWCRRRDLAEPGAVKPLTARLRELNPRAVIDVAVEGRDRSARCSPTPGRPTPSSGIPASSPRPRTATASRSFVLRDDAPLEWAGVPSRDGDADRAARSRSAARQGAAQPRGLPRPGGVPGRAAPDASAGRAVGLARQGPREPRGVHHPQPRSARSAICSVLCARWRAGPVAQIDERSRLPHAFPARINHV